MTPILHCYSLFFHVYLFLVMRRTTAKFGLYPCILSRKPFQIGVGQHACAVTPSPRPELFTIDIRLNNCSAKMLRSAKLLSGSLLRNADSLAVRYVVVLRIRFEFLPSSYPVNRER